MKDKIDYQNLPPEFLIERFPSPDKYHELSKNPPESTLAVSEERYLTMKDNINKALQGTGIKLTENHLAIIIRHMEGHVVLPKNLNPNKQL